MPKKILILYTSVGLGHKSIAENIGYHLENAGYQVKLHDVLQLQAGKLVSVSIVVQQFINRRSSFVWKWLYVHADHGWFAYLTLPQRVKTASRNYQQVKQVIDEFQPDLVIATQTSASAIIQYLKQQGWYKGLFGIAFSDYHLHRYWLYDAADFYLANIEEQKHRMMQLGIPAEKIFVIGMTLKSRPKTNTSEVRARLGLAPQDKVILVASGSLGTGWNAAWLIKLSLALQNIPQTKLIIICGQNQRLRQALQQRIKSPNVIVQGYYTPMAELYAITDIFLTKPGGLTVAEALQNHLPLLITHWLPGQEELNYYYLLKQKLIMNKPQDSGTTSILGAIRQELGTRAFRQSLISNAALVDLIQEKQEGQKLVQAIRQMFHEV